MHLLMDGFGGDEEKLKSEDFVHGFLDKLPDEIGMTKINGPHVMTYNGPKEDDWGVSGFVMIAESHISVHTFPDRSYVNIDVFSCKDFDHERVLERGKRPLWTGSGEAVGHRARAGLLPSQFPVPGKARPG